MSHFLCPGALSAETDHGMNPKSEVLVSPEHGSVPLEDAG
jgi:hypothetical protein